MINYNKLCNIQSWSQLPSIIDQNAIISGCYILFNTTQNKYYVGQAKNIYQRLKQHIQGMGNTDVYHDILIGNSFLYTILSLKDSECNSLDEEESELITHFNAYTNGYNKTQGNHLSNHISNTPSQLPLQPHTTQAVSIIPQATPNPMSVFTTVPKWDGIDRLSNALQKYCGAESTNISTWALQYWMTGYINRLTHPGSIFSEMLLFIGNKQPVIIFFSNLLRCLKHQLTIIPDTLLATPMQAHQTAILIDNLDDIALHPAKHKDFSDYLWTKTQDTYIKPYTKEIVSIPRHCTFIGNLSQNAFIQSQHLWKNCIPIQLPEVFSPSTIPNESELMQCWSQALSDTTLFNSTGILLSQAQMTNINIFFNTTTATPTELKIKQWLSSTQTRRVCVLQLWKEALGNENRPTRQQINELHEIMRFKMQGWELYKAGSRALCGEYGVQKCYVREQDNLIRPPSLLSPT